MKKGIELIAQERKEQIEKHGFTWERYDRYYTHGELLQAACFCLNLANPQFYFLHEKDQHIIPQWPKGWDLKFKNKIIAKDKIGQLKVAGAFFMAENERIGNAVMYKTYIDKIAIEIDRLQSMKS